MTTIGYCHLQILLFDFVDFHKLRDEIKKIVGVS